MDVAVFVLVVLIRAGVPLLLFRWPFYAALLCIAADASDTVIPEALGTGTITSNYHAFDKGFDIYYLAVEAIVVQRWADPLPRWTATGLFAMRFTAVVLFEITGVRALFLLLGPNVFENFYLWNAACRSADPSFRIDSKGRLALTLALVGAPKLLQEYVMHFREAQTWHFVKEQVLQWK